MQTLDPEPTTRDDERAFAACRHFDTFPLADDDMRLDRSIYQAFNDRFEEPDGYATASVERDELLEAAADTKSADVLTRLLEWFDADVFQDDYTLEVSRSGRGAIEITATTPARDYRYTPLEVSVTYGISGAATVAVSGCRTTGSRKQVWVGRPDEVDSATILESYAETVLPSVVSRVAELAEDGPLSHRRAEVIALMEVGWSNAEIADELPVDEQSVRSYQSKTRTATREGERLFVALIGDHRSIIESVEIVSGGGYPRRYYICEAANPETQEVALVAVDDKPSGPSVRTLTYDTLEELVEAHEADAEFEGWEDTLHAAADKTASST